MRRIVLLFLLLLSIIPLRSLVYATREGVDSPLPVNNHKITITDSQYVMYLYSLLLNRPADDLGGLLNTYQLTQSNWTKAQVFAAILASPEFANNQQVQSDESYIERLYQTLFFRTPDPEGRQAQLNYLNQAYGQGKSKDTAWFDLFTVFLNYPEFQTKNCITQSYSYGRPLNNSSASLTNLFSGQAHFQSLAESESVQLTFPNPQVKHVWDQKISLFHQNNTYFGITKGYLGDSGPFDIYLFQSADGVHFNQAQPIFTANGRQNVQPNLYDPHISFDPTFCPARYVMTMECDGSLCISESSTPQIPWTWQNPQKIVQGGLINQKYRSAATGTTITDANGKRFVYWTVVDDGTQWFETFNAPATRLPDDGNESTYTNAREILPNQSILNPDEGVTVLNAEPNVFCNASWDCNNRDKQDVKYENGYYYLSYNGSNYYRCTRPASDASYSNDWGLAIGRSQNPLGNFNEDKTQKLIDSERKDICGISYPMLNEVNGELYMYYAYYPSTGGNRTMRSKLVWNDKPGDINKDEVVTIADIQSFLLQPIVSLFPYANILKNYGL